MVRDGHLTYRPDIDGLRAIAVLSVVAFHAFPTAVRGGFVGVDIFFVISGYLISSIIFSSQQRGTFNFAEFYIRRIKRIFPALILVLIACTVFGWFTLLASEFRMLGKHIVAGAGFVANIVLWSEVGYFDGNAETKPLLHLWSLGVEEQFYIVWPLLLILVWKKRWNALLAIACIVVASFAYNIWTTFRESSWAFYLPIARFWELLLGATLAYLHTYHAAKCHDFLGRIAFRIGTGYRGAITWEHACSTVGFLLLIAAIGVTHRAYAFPGWWALLPTVGATLLIAAGPSSWINRKVLSNRIFVLVGLISYPLYLWHWPLLSYARVVAPDNLSVAARVLAVATACGLAYLTYRYVEIPVRANKHHSRQAAYALAGLMAAVAVVGAASQFGAIQVRLNTPKMASIDQAIHDWNFPENTYWTIQNETFQLVNRPDANEPVVMLIGDSHMEQYWSRIQKLTSHETNKRRIIFLTYAGCAILPNVKKLRGNSRCEEFFDFAIREANAPNVRTVVFSGWWENYFPKAHAKRDQYALNDGANSRLTIPGPAADRVFATFEKNLANLVASGKRVYVALSNPTSPSYDPMNMIPFRLGRGDSLRGPSTLDKSDYVAARKPVVDHIVEVARRSGARIIDPIEFLCRNSVCPTRTEGGEPLYMDDHHIRATIAADRVSFLDALILENAG